MRRSTATRCATCCSKIPSPPAPSSFRTKASYPIDQRPGGWYDWFTRREFHDDHAAFFASDFTGRQEIFYMIRVVNPGTLPDQPRARSAHVPPWSAGNERQRSSCGSRIRTAGRRSTMTMRSSSDLARRLGAAQRSPRPGPNRTRDRSSCFLCVAAGAGCEHPGRGWLRLLALLIVVAAGLGESRLILGLSGRPLHGADSSAAHCYCCGHRAMVRLERSGSRT